MNEQIYMSLAEGLRQVAMAEARGYIANADDVEDVAQEVMLRLWEKRAEIQNDSKMLRAYVATMARNVCKDRQKVKRRHPLLRFLWVTKDDDEDVYEIPSHDTPHKRMEATESITVYRQALKRLPYNWQKILVMRGEEEMSYTEIAHILGTTESSVRGTLSKAKKKILELIKQNI